MNSNDTSQHTSDTSLHILNTPVLFLVFNRPDTTKLVFQAIRQARPPRLYVAADGPRSNVKGEAERCAKVKEIVAEVDWPCEVKQLFREKNTGCKKAVSRAITWFFEHEETGIILEDDCLPNDSFFWFCEENLQRYKHDDRVVSINGNHSIGSIFSASASYYFTVFPNVWGWASWRRAWSLYDVSISKWPEYKTSGALTKLFPGKYSRIADDWKYMFDTAYENKIDTWDHQFVFMSFVNNKLAIQPYVNLVKNIGHGPEATHTKKQNTKRANQQTTRIAGPLRHPLAVSRDYLMEEETIKNRSGFISFLKIVKRRLSRISRIFTGLCGG